MASGIGVGWWMRVRGARGRSMGCEGKLTLRREGAERESGRWGVKGNSRGGTEARSGRAVDGRNARNGIDGRYGAERGTVRETGH